MADKDRNRAAEVRAERIGWKRRKRMTSPGSRSMDESARQLDERSSALDKRLRDHAEQTATWHRKWDDPRSSTN